MPKLTRRKDDLGRPLRKNRAVLNGILRIYGQALSTHRRAVIVMINAGGPTPINDLVALALARSDVGLPVVR